MNFRSFLNILGAWIFRIHSLKWQDALNRIHPLIIESATCSGTPSWFKVMNIGITQLIASKFETLLCNACMFSLRSCSDTFWACPRITTFPAVLRMSALLKLDTPKNPHGFSPRSCQSWLLFTPWGAPKHFFWLMAPTQVRGMLDWSFCRWCQCQYLEHTRICGHLWDFLKVLCQLHTPPPTKKDQIRMFGRCISSNRMPKTCTDVCRPTRRCVRTDKPT